MNPKLRHAQGSDAESFGASSVHSFGDPSPLMTPGHPVDLLFFFLHFLCWLLLRVAGAEAPRPKP